MDEHFDGSQKSEYLTGFNKVMEAGIETMLDGDEGESRFEKPTGSSTMEERKAYIRAKYMDRRFVAPCYANQTEVYLALEQSIENPGSHSLGDLLQAFGEAPVHRVDLTDALPTSEFGETVLHK